MPSLFQLGDFTLHSGGKSRWRIDCDALTPEDWQALAAMAVERLPPFGSVVGVPRGGLKFAAALRPYCDPASTYHLIVDDVLTTGASMEELRQLSSDPHPIGCVAFARGPCPGWVTPLLRAY